MQGGRQGDGRNFHLLLARCRSLFAAALRALSAGGQFTRGRDNREQTAGQGALFTLYSAYCLPQPLRRDL